MVEHVVVDNCSDDETPEVLARYPEIRSIVEPDKGQSEALNKGFAAARGEWILWLNVDDFMVKGAIDELIELLQSEGEQLDMIYGHTVFVDAESRKIRTIYQPRWYYWMAQIGSYVAPSTGSLFRRKWLVDHPLGENYHMIMDTEWMLRVGMDLRVKRLNQELVSFRIADNKTAAHIQSGHVTEQHQKERDRLQEHYPFYYFRKKDDPPSLKSAFLWTARKVSRGVQLVDKQFCKLSNRA